MIRIYPRHGAFAEAVQAGRVQVQIRPEHARAVIQRAPEVFGTGSWQVMQGCGCLPLVLLGAAAWGWQWGWLPVCLGLVVCMMMFSAAHNSLNKEMIRAVVERCFVDEALYHSLLTQNLLLVFGTELDRTELE